MRRITLLLLSLSLLIMTAGTTVAQDGEREYPAVLEHHADTPEEAVAELESLELIPEDGRLRFQEDYAFVSGRGLAYAQFSILVPRTDVVMAGELSFTSSGSEGQEVCSLTTRIDWGNHRAITYVDVGLTSAGELRIADVTEPDGEPITLEVMPLDLDMSQPHHLLALLIADTATVYVDGELAVADVPVFGRTGTYAITLSSQGLRAQCEARNVWGYEVPPHAEQGQCIVATTRTINRRSGPGTAFSAEGFFVLGERSSVQAQATGTDGKLWWQLEDGSWVRDDVVDAVGDCASVPTVQP